MFSRNKAATFSRSESCVPDICVLQFCLPDYCYSKCSPDLNSVSRKALKKLTDKLIERAEVKKPELTKIIRQDLNLPGPMWKSICPIKQIRELQSSSSHNW